MPDPTAEQLARESGEAMANAIADNLEAVILKLTDRIATLQAEQAELRDTVLTLSEKGTRHELILEEHRSRLHRVYDHLGFV